MPRRFFKRILPDPHKIQNASFMRPLKSFTTNRQLWTSKRRNIVWGLAIGIFCGFQPIPAHTMLAVLLAIVFRANLPMAVVSTLISNPITMVPLYYLGYKIGCAILGIPDLELPTDVSSFERIKSLLQHGWLPVYFGNFVTGLFFSLLSSFSLNEFWKWAVLKRRKLRLLRTAESARLAQDNVEYKKKIDLGK